MMKAMIRPFNHGLTRDLDRIFSDCFNVPTIIDNQESEFVPRVNIRDDKDHVSLSFEIPGMEKKDIKVMVKDGDLIVSGQREFKSEEKDETFIRSEIRTGKFSRSFSLPETVNAENISADYKNGILEVRLAKLEEVKPKEIEVKVS
jgi:HSP20 family protein